MHRPLDRQRKTLGGWPCLPARGKTGEKDAAPTALRQTARESFLQFIAETAAGARRVSGAPVSLYFL